MKRVQMGIAFAVLVLMVFLVTFAMNYLGSNVQAPDDPTPGRTVRTVTFLQKVFPPETVAGLEAEIHASGSVDYAFYNPNAEEVKLGLDRKSCRCAGVEVLVMAAANRRLVAPWAVALCGTGGLAPLLAVPLAGQGMAALEKGASSTELLEKNESVTVPGNMLGWVRLHYKGERAGPQALSASLWMDDRAAGQPATLQLRMVYFPPFANEPTLDVGTLRDDDLQRGVTRYLVVWSATRSHLRLEAKSTFVRGTPAQDPFVVGRPEPMSVQEITPMGGGPAKCAYRVPITLLPRSPDGKVPFDVGPFRRWVSVSSPDVTEEPRPVAVVGRVRGLVEIGSDDEINEINFSTFPATRGRRATIELYSDSPDVQLTFDRERTPEFLAATVTELKGPDRRRAWQLRAEVLPRKAAGPFPRRADPAYRDSAIYLNAQVPGKPPRSIRIGVVGTASAG